MTYKRGWRSGRVYQFKQTKRGATALARRWRKQYRKARIRKLGQGLYIVVARGKR